MKEPEQTQGSCFILPELICSAWKEYGYVPGPVLGYIPSAARWENTKHVK
jgi:hypothetical protein